MLFSKFQDHTAALDVWSFGMIMFCVLFGTKPTSFYSIYRKWYLKSHNHDVDMGTLPFIPPSKANFIYDPFSIDFENPFDKTDFDLVVDQIAESHLQEEEESGAASGSLNFANFMKCIENLSYSSLFSSENSKKFNLSSIADEIKSMNNPDM